jgi:pyrimidine-nucleoside phosphorylase
VKNGSAFEMFRKLVAAQGGDVSYVDQPGKMAKARLVEPVPSPESGCLSQIHARMIGEAAVELGAGRAKKGDPVDHAVGFMILRKVGEKVQSGEPLFVVHANDEGRLAAAKKAVLAAHQFSAAPVPPLPLFYEH